MPREAITTRAGKRVALVVSGEAVKAVVELNAGQQVQMLLDRISLPYYALASFDDLPTPFRTVAADLRSAAPVVFAGGSLADAMRATMAIPGAFAPVEIGQWLLVDGGVLNNVPADVVRGPELHHAHPARPGVHAHIHQVRAEVVGDVDVPLVRLVIEAGVGRTGEGQVHQGQAGPVGRRGHLAERDPGLVLAL